LAAAGHRAERQPEGETLREGPAAGLFYACWRTAIRASACALIIRPDRVNGHVGDVSLFADNLSGLVITRRPMV
jgi:hypothetical protein